MDMPLQMAEGGIVGLPQMTPIAREMAAMGRNGDTMLAHITPQEAMMFENGARAVGAAVLPAGTGQTELQAQAAHDGRPWALVREGRQHEAGHGTVADRRAGGLQGRS